MGKVALVVGGVWYYVWGQWEVPFGITHRTYRGVSYSVGNFLCGLFAKPDAYTADRPYCWTLLPPDGATIPSDLTTGSTTGFASGADANAAAKAAIDAYLNAHAGVLPFAT